MEGSGRRTFRCVCCGFLGDSLQQLCEHAQRDHHDQPSVNYRIEWVAEDEQVPQSSRSANLHVDDSLQGPQVLPAVDSHSISDVDQISLDDQNLILDGLLDLEEELLGDMDLEELPELNLQEIIEMLEADPEDLEIDADLGNYKERFCPACLVKFKDAGDLDLHRYVFHPEHYEEGNQIPQQRGGAADPANFNILFRELGGAGGVSMEFEADLTDHVFADISGVMRSSRGSLIELLRRVKEDFGAFKIIVRLNAEMQRNSRENPSEVQIESFPFSSFLHTCLDVSMIRTVLRQIQQKIRLSVESFLLNGSGWKLRRFLSMNVRVMLYRMDRANCWLPTPPYIRDKRCVVNIRNADEKCFKYSILAELTPLYRDGRTKWRAFTDPRSYKHDGSGIFWGCVNYPMTIAQLDKFHHFNPRFAVNVFGYDEVDELDPSFKKKKIHVFPLYVCKQERPINIDLLMIIEGEKAHFTLLRQSDFNPTEGLSRLLGKGERNYEKYVCRFCLCYSKSLDKLKEHQWHCISLDLQRAVLPTEKFYEFSQIKQTLPVPFVIYVDFEAVLSPVDGIGTRQIGDVYSEHIDCGWSIAVIGLNGYPVIPVKTFCGQQAALKLMEELIKIADALFPRLRADVGRDPRWSEKDIRKLKVMASNCIHCGREFRSEAEKRLDHCHMSSAIRGISCNECNLLAIVASFIPVVCHGFRHYDSKFIVQAIQNCEWKAVEVLASSSTEKFTALRMTTHKDSVIRMIDSYQFISSSLAEQVEMLARDGKHLFLVTSQHFAEHSSKMDLLLRKGVYPYSYMSSFEKFEETCLPPKDAWTSDLTGKPISDEDFLHAQTVWKEFGCRTLRDYHNLYVTLDTCLLADCFQKFRGTMMESFRIDPLHYITLPGIAYDAAMLAGRVTFEYLDEVEKYTFFERGIRGGICCVGLRHAKANNKYIGAGFDATLPTSFLCFWDANLLYSTCLRNFVPWKEFCWDPSLENRTSRLDLVVKMLMSMADEGDYGCVLEVDLTYPAELHDYHNDFPLAVERAQIEFDSLSSYTHNIMKNVGATAGSIRKSKLVGNLLDKKNYIVHYRLLKLYLELGLKLTKVHRAIRFKQAPLFRVYTDICIERRRNATSQVDKKFYKAMGNILAGKVYQNVRKYKRINVALSTDKMREYAKKPTVEDFKIIHDECILFVMRKLAVKLDRPVFVGQCILDDSKKMMYSLYYRYLKPKYQDKMRLVYCDTDSFLLQIQTDDIYQDVAASVSEGEGIFDTSNFDKHDTSLGFLWSDTNQGAGGYFKDETANAVITEVVALKPKVYCVKTILPNGTVGVIKKAKGTVRAMVERELEFEDYKRVLEEGSYKCVKMNTIRSLNQRLYTTSLYKKSLSSLEDKAFYLNSIESLKFGHYKLNDLEEANVVDEDDDDDD